VEIFTAPGIKAEASAMGAAESTRVIEFTGLDGVMAPT
jgi:hypothetical protein